ncbi:glycosyltransferase [Paenibacillus sp. FSL L8-0340]|uniref:glycosyltransferase family 2 protein n=1 Tax=Paenibacillus sp. FSL L8-0340 TaxID=2954685 RepID=UPI003158F78C
MSGPQTRVLLGSPIHQKPLILHQFLKSLLRLQLEGVELDFYFIDDNEDEASSSLLQEFSKSANNVFLQSSGFRDTYVRDDHTHFWNSGLVWKVAGFKNLMIRRAEAFGYDYLFLIDSDLILHPDTLLHLIQTQKDIISEVFWTQWQPNTMLQPQVWMHDEYNQWEALPGEKLTHEEINHRFHAFLAKLQQPGIYEVGGLGACTLISRRAIESGVSYDVIRNISYWGEDRHFCIRAAALGIPLYVDTHYPALHLYRDSDLSKVEDYIRLTSPAPEAAVGGTDNGTDTADTLGTMGGAQAAAAPGGVQEAEAVPGVVEETEGSAAPGDVQQTEPSAAPGDVQQTEPSATPGDVQQTEPSAAPGDVQQTVAEAGQAAKAEPEAGSGETLVHQDSPQHSAPWTAAEAKVRLSKDLPALPGDEPAEAANRTANAVPSASAATASPAARRPKLTLTMVVKNESQRFLRQILQEHRKYIDEAVIIDDGSTDNTADICREALQGIPLFLIHNTVSKFSNEAELRKQQWDEVVKSGPEWILSLDADEIFEERFAGDIDALLREDACDLFCFRLYDFWDDHHYREDRYWRSHHSYRPFLLRYREGFPYIWNESPQHCGRLPENIFELPHQLSNLRLKHLGWSRPEFRLDKYLRYMLLDPDGIYGWKEQYASILEQHPNLVPWIE